MSKSAIASAMANHKAKQEIIKKQIQNFVAPAGYLVISNEFYNCSDEIIYNGQKVRHKSRYNFEEIQAHLRNSPKMQQKGYAEYKLAAIHIMTIDGSDEMEFFEYSHNGKTFYPMRVINPEYNRCGQTFIYRVVLGCVYGKKLFEPKSHWVIYEYPGDAIGSIVKDLADERDKELHKLIAAFPRVR